MFIADATACSALFSTFDRHVPQLQGLVNDHIAQSFLYSIMVYLLLPLLIMRVFPMSILPARAVIISLTN